MPFAYSDGTPIWWDERGDREPTLLLIQGLGFPSSMWFRVLPALSGHFRVVVFDNRGCGRTGAPPGPYPIETMADDAAAVLDAAGVGAAHVLGISMGGLIAQELALRHGDRVASLMLAATHPGGSDAILPPPDVLQLLQTRADLSPEESVRATIPVAYTARTNPEWIEEDVRARLSDPTPPEGYLGQLMGGLAYQGSIPRLHSLAVPTLCLHGTADRLVPPKNAEVLAQAVPGARIEWIPQAGHVLFTEAPAAFVDTIVSSVKQVPQSTTR